MIRLKNRQGKLEVCGVQDILYSFQAMGMLSILRRSWGWWGSTLIVWSGNAMKAGRPTSLLPGKIDYKQLRKVNPEAARLAVLEYLGTNGHNISQAASVFGISRSVVYDILRKEKEGDLRDQPRTPRHQPGWPYCTNSRRESHIFLNP